MSDFLEGGTMALEFMIWDHVTRPEGESLAALYAQRIDLVQMAESAGFSHYHVAEHHGHRLSMAPSQFVYLAAVARETDAIRLGTMVTCLPLHHPVRLAEELCMLDQLSGGRLEWGYGKGISPFEHRTFGHEPDEASDRAADMLPMILEGLEHGVMRSERSKYFEFPEADLAMEPFQRPYPELWYPANIAYAAERNLHLVLEGFVTQEQRDTFDALVAANGTNPERLNPHVDRPRLASMLFCVAADDEDTARRLGEEAAQTYPAFLFRSSGYLPPHLQLDRPDEVEQADPRRVQLPADLGMSFTELIRQRFNSTLVCGTPDQIVAALLPYLASIPIDVLSLGLFPGNLSLDATRRSVELVANEVLPALRSAGH